jgi:hypothetical protein
MILYKRIYLSGWSAEKTFTTQPRKTVDGKYRFEPAGVGI